MGSESVEGTENVYASYASDATPCGCTPSWTRVLEIRRKHSVRKSLGVGWATPVRRRQHDDMPATLTCLNCERSWSEVVKPYEPYRVVSPGVIAPAAMERRVI